MSADPSSSSNDGLRERKSKGSAPEQSDTTMESIEPFLEEEATSKSSSSPLKQIDWVPLQVPWHRRLQTTAVVLTFALIPACIVLTIMCLLNPMLWLPFGLYVIFVLTDRASEKGGRPVLWVKNLFIWNFLRDFFPIRLQKTVDLPTDRNYIIGYHPHGIISVGAFVNFGTNSTGFPKLFPGIDLRLCTLAPNFKVPFLSTFLLSLGLISANRGAITSVVKRKKMADGTYAKGTGKAAMIVVGGAEEALYAKPGSATLVLGKRFGFVKLALQNGSSLVPVYSFGENDLFEQEEPTAAVKKINDFTKKTYGTTFPLFHGRGVFSYNFGLLPYRRTVTSVVGEPIECPLIENPTDEQVKEYHDKYLAALHKVWDDHKKSLYSKRTGTLVIK